MTEAEASINLWVDIRYMQEIADMAITDPLRHMRIAAWIFCSPKHLKDFPGPSSDSA